MRSGLHCQEKKFNQFDLFLLTTLISSPQTTLSLLNHEDVTQDKASSDMTGMQEQQNSLKELVIHAVLFCYYSACGGFSYVDYLIT